jgi:predicted short-subunit dehydrogenase-like oxidoreductase (DUF2520 family)
MRIVLLGTGNLATRLGLALQAKNAEVVQVYGRNVSGTAALADLMGCPWTTDKAKIIQDAELYILAVTEEAIPQILRDAPIRNHLLVHTSGSVQMDILASFSENFGVFYPLQTLSAQKAVDFSQVPICVEANNSENLETLSLLAHTISEHVLTVNSVQRRELHLAAVFVCNFVNHLYTIGEKLLQEQQLDFSLLKPLILETANKAMAFAPATVQTGPAIRGNQHIMEQHLKMLEQHPAWQEIYERMSVDIQAIRKQP